MAMNKLINLSLLLLLKNNMLYKTIMLAHYIKFGKFHTDMLKKSLTIALLVGPYIFDLLHKASILEDYNPMNYGKWMKLTALNFLPLPSYMSQSIQILLLYGPHLSEVKLHDML